MANSTHAADWPCISEVLHCTALRGFLMVTLFAGASLAEHSAWIHSIQELYTSWPRLCGNKKKCVLIPLCSYLRKKLYMVPGPACNLPGVVTCTTGQLCAAIWHLTQADDVTYHDMCTADCASTVAVVTRLLSGSDYLLQTGCTSIHLRKSASAQSRFG